MDITFLIVVITFLVVLAVALVVYKFRKLDPLQPTVSVDRSADAEITLMSAPPPVVNETAPVAPAVAAKTNAPKTTARKKPTRSKKS